MSKALKKLIDINRLREFKNKLVGAGSAYVQTAAVDQTIAGTKTFSKPIVGSVTGNAATATKATQDAAGNTITTTYATKAHTHTKSQITDFPALATVATSGSYTDLANKPAIPTVNNATLTIQKNGTTVKTFTANASANVTANITVPTKVSELTNDSGFLTSHQSLSNYVTLNGAQTISGAKTFTGNIIGINKERSTEDANSLYSTTAGSKLTYYTTSNGGTTLTNVPATVNTTLESRTIRRLSDSDWIVEQICHNSNGLYYRKGSNGTWGAWKTFAFTDSNISGNAATATTATTAKSCTGNAATATKATQDSAGQQIDTTYIKGLAVSGRTITYTKGDGTTGTITTQDTNTWTAFKGATASANGTAGYVPAPTKGNQGKFFKADGTWATPPNTTYASMSASEATTGTATAARTISAKVLHDKINSNLSAYATKTELNNGLATKANDKAVVHKSGNETIAGTKTFNDNVHATGFHATAPNALMAQRDGYTLVLRNDGDNTYLLMSDKGGVPGTWSSARPLVISNSGGVCDINGNAATATKLATARTIALSGAATGTATAFDGSGDITIPVTALSPSAIRAQWYAAYPDGPEAHNAMWGGRDITAAFNAGTVSANIANGTFRDIFPGDYITKQVTISGTTYTVNWVIADCDYWWHKGDQNNGMETHHVVIVPQATIVSANMNATNTTEGGYMGSRMFKETIPACATGIVNAFGASHILTFRDCLISGMTANQISSGLPNFTGGAQWDAWSWVSVQCDLMTEKMVLGAPMNSASAIDEWIATRQMSAFRLSGKLINCNRQLYWLRNIVSSAHFPYAGGFGGVGPGYASRVLGVRPFALLR